MNMNDKVVARLEWQKDEILRKLEQLGSDPDSLEEKKRLQKELGTIWLRLFIHEMFPAEERSADFFDKLFKVIKILLSIDCVFEVSHLIIAFRADNPRFQYLENEEELCIPLLLVKNLLDKGHEEQTRLSIEFLCLESLECEVDDRIIIQ